MSRRTGNDTPSSYQRFHPYRRNGAGFGRAYVPTSATLSIHNIEVQKRIKRALEQRLFVVDNANVSSTCRKFTIFGSVGNLYTVQIGSDVSCTCPDFAKGFHNCKHLLYVMIRVLRIPQDDARLLNKRFEVDDVARLLRDAPPVHSTCMVDSRVRTAYDLIKHGVSIQDVVADHHLAAAAKEATTSNALAVDLNSLPSCSLTGQPRASLDDPDELCAICFDELSSKDHTVWCRRQCGKNVHKQCMDMWIKHKQRDRVMASCPSCRAEPWLEGHSTNNVTPLDTFGNTVGAVSAAAAAQSSTAGSTTVRSNDGYINLAFACDTRTYN